MSVAMRGIWRSQLLLLRPSLGGGLCYAAFILRHEQGEPNLCQDLYIYHCHTKAGDSKTIRSYCIISNQLAVLFCPALHGRSGPVNLHLRMNLVEYKAS